MPGNKDIRQATTEVLATAREIAVSATVVGIGAETLHPPGKARSCTGFQFQSPMTKTALKKINLGKDVVHPWQIRLLSMAIHRHYSESSGGEGHGSVHRGRSKMGRDANRAGAPKHRPPQDGGAAIASGETARTQGRRRSGKGRMPTGIVSGTAGPSSIANMAGFLQTDHRPHGQKQNENLGEASSSELSDVNGDNCERIGRQRGKRIPRQGTPEEGVNLPISNRLG